MDPDKMSEQELRREVKELRAGKCRLNCRSVKEAYLAGYGAAVENECQYYNHDPYAWASEAEGAYKDWNNERP
jgi:hypothetical protein